MPFFFCALIIVCNAVNGSENARLESGKTAFSSEIGNNEQKITNLICEHFSINVIQLVRKCYLFFDKFINFLFIYFKIHGILFSIRERV